MRILENIRLPGILFFSWFFENIYRLQWGIDIQGLKVLSFSTLLQFFVLQPCFDFFYIISSWIFLESRNWITSFFANAEWQGKFLIFEFVYWKTSANSSCAQGINKASKCPAVARGDLGAAGIDWCIKDTRKNCESCLVIIFCTVWNNEVVVKLTLYGVKRRSGIQDSFLFYQWAKVVQMKIIFF